MTKLSNYYGKSLTQYMKNFKNLYIYNIYIFMYIMEFFIVLKLINRRKKQFLRKQTNLKFRFAESIREERIHKYQQNNKFCKQKPKILNLYRCDRHVQNNRKYKQEYYVLFNYHLLLLLLYITILFEFTEKEEYLPELVGQSSKLRFVELLQKFRKQIQYILFSYKQ